MGQEILYVLAIWASLGAVVLLAWYASRRAEKRSADRCRALAQDFLERAARARGEIMLVKTWEERDRLALDASQLTKEADYWRERAKKWDRGDI